VRTPEEERALELSRLMQRRDMAAYTLTATVWNVIAFAEAMNYEDALAQLRQGYAEFAALDLQIRQIRKGAQHNGNRPAAA